MQPGHIDLLIFLVGLAVLAAFAWLVAWLIGFPEWAGLTTFVTTGMFLAMCLITGVMVLTDMAQRQLLGPIQGCDDRGTCVPLRWERERIDAAERKALRAVSKRVLRVRDVVRTTVIMLLAWAILWAVWQGVIAIAEPYVIEGSITSIAMLFLGTPAAGLVVFLVVVTRVCSRLQQTLEARALPLIGRCGACGYSLREIPPEDDGCRVCPECGAAWKLGADEPTLSAHGEDAGDDEC